MGVPFNELNRVFDLGFKPLPCGDQGHIPSTMRPAEGGAPLPKAPPSSAANGASASHGVTERNPFSRLAAALTTRSKRSEPAGVQCSDFVGP
jgi:hypothetical protein